MEQQQPSSLLQRYRRDRRKLLEFLLSSGLIKELRTRSGPTTNVDFDNLSADYILDCVKSGGVVDVSEATKKYYADYAYPVMIQSQLRNSYFLLSDPDLAGSPPRREPPPVKMNRTTKVQSPSNGQLTFSNAEKLTTSRDDIGLNYEEATTSSMTPVVDSEIPPLGLPRLKTGFSDDDLRESAYELLLAAMCLYGVEIYSVEERKKEKTSKVFPRLKSKRDKRHQQYQSSEQHPELIDTVRIQMQISEAMDACTRRSLMPWASGRQCGHIDLPQISIGLLSGIFKSDFVNEKYYMQWKCRQANILEELLFSSNLCETDHQTIRSCLAKIRDAKEWDVAMSPIERVEVLSTIRQVALKVSSLPGKFGVQREVYYWTASYHLNIRLYEKLLFGVFDVLEEGQLIEEANDVLMLFKFTWSTLGITQKMHNALYGWILFQQFVRTDEGMLLESAVLELQKVLSAEEDDGKEGQYMNSLLCSRKFNDSHIELSLVKAIFLSISIWCDSKLQDYHLHFCRKPCNFRRVMNLVSAVGVLASGDYGEVKLTRWDSMNDDVARKFKTYIERSTEAAYVRVAKLMVSESKVKRMHPLALLANELRLVAQREFNMFFPVLRNQCPESFIISAMMLHQFYGERLKPFLEGVLSLSEDARSVLPAADMLDHELTQLYNSALKENGLHLPFEQDLDHYPIGKFSGPLIIDWVIAQHAHILGWTGRAFDLEDWEPLSYQQKQGASVIEIFRILEETVDQFFGLNLPMDVTHLQAILSVIFHSLDSYLLKLLNQLVKKNHLYPSAPPLTRYTETVIPTTKKKLLKHTLLDDNVSNKLNVLTTPKLCVRLNTLQYIQKQIGMLEEGIRKSWALVRTSLDRKWGKEVSPEIPESDVITSSEAMDELFATTFNSIRDTATDAIDKISDFIGAKVVFWDLRDVILSHLYLGNVESARLDNLLPHIDTVLDSICGLIDDSLRDLVVSSICRASLEGFAWVLLDGGPSRAFSDSDIKMMEDDLKILKEFFIADGEGLPRSLVEKEAKSAEHILSLYSLETETVIQMLMAASEHISMGLDSHKHGPMHLEDTHTLMRVLCHKKDREASKFLKRHFQLPLSSDYDDTPSRQSNLKSPLVADLLKRSTSSHWTKTSQHSFKSFKKKLQEATSEIRNVAW
ncbi:DUF810 domain-containing protein [Cephalotus follicularis]|uniref:DUF810 domain-containing protein n=1 Tax=Cephalotus follicularis TaxID=3775 RepID=A0A1Q3BM37_CEPFO|nr:DUF810 domain-containing protein [Cephalotus follicularis]